MKQFFLGLGSNLGNCKKNVLKAFDLLSKLPQITEFNASSLYQTSPISNIPQNDYINAVCSFKSKRSPIELYEHTQQIESLFGKKSSIKNAPRYLDIDFLYVQGVFTSDPPLILPHPRLFERLFVLKPLSELTSSLEFLSKGSSSKVYSLQKLITQLEEDSTQTVQQIASS